MAPVLNAALNRQLLLLGLKPAVVNGTQTERGKKLKPTDYQVATQF